MEIYSTEEQQVEAIKRFWKDYGTPILIGAVVGLGGLYGWNYYSDHTVSLAENASDAYSAAMANKADPAALAGDIAKFDKEHDQKGYQAMLQLTLAKAAADADELDKAETALKAVLTEKPGQGLEEVATMRLARVQAQLGKTSEALTTLSRITSEAFAAQRDELKGDLLVRQGDLTQAREAYKAAMESGQNASNPVLKMKLDNLTQA